MVASLEERLREEDGQWPAAWKPRTAGEMLIGTVKRYSTGQSAYGPVRTVIIERPDGSRLSVWLSSTVLLSLFDAERPSIGERIGIKFLGKHETKGYKRWSLIVDRDEAALSFAPLGGERGEPAAADDDGDPFGAIPTAAGGRR